jgi:hypothetical protein
MGEDWSDIEVDIILSEYFDMLTKEISGHQYVKSHHRKRIAPLLNNRSEGSIEFKFQNISAVLSKFGAPWIVGYKPRWNYQHLLESKIAKYISHKPELEILFRSFAETVSEQPNAMGLDYKQLIDAAPEPRLVSEPELVYKTPVKRNYLEIEQSNKLLGDSGEEIVFNYEKWRLLEAGKDSLADNIEWVSQTQGDGLGYDILSKNTNGTDRYIEVKTTKLGKDAPIFFSRNEYDFSAKNADKYFLYRVFNFSKTPKVFIATGTFDDFCKYKPIQFKGIF